jgi:hypothetical protein
MKSLRHAAIALLAVVVLGAGAARGASTANFTDQWWIEVESGWGGAVLQQGDTLFIDLFVYGPDGKPTWFVAAAVYQPGSPAGHAVFTGDLYTATGPYYGGPFNAAPVVGRKVGTLTFDADTATTAALTYSVDGTPVSKAVTRQTWARQDMSGRYYGGDSGDQTACGSDNGHFEGQDYIDVTHAADNTFTMTWTDPQGRTVTMTGTYSQSGHVGQVAVTGGGSVGFAEALTGISGTLFEIESSIAGITGRGHLVLQTGSSTCTWDGRWGGVRR